MSIIPKGFRRPRPIFYVAAATVIALLIWVGASFARPFLIAADMVRENERLEKEAMELRIEQQELRKRNAFVQTDAGKELEARRRGYVKADEVPLIIPNAAEQRQP